LKILKLLIGSIFIAKHRHKINQPLLKEEKEKVINETNYAKLILGTLAKQFRDFLDACSNVLIPLEVCRIVHLSLLCDSII